jgi:glycosyltransferase involved in cell wall biosynthesis
MKFGLKRWVFRLLGKDPEAVVVVLGSGPHGEELRRLVPDRRLIFVDGQGSAGEVWLRLRRQLAPYRVALLAVRAEARPQLAAALLAFPTRVLAFRDNLDRHHLRPATLIASSLFAAGVPLDRIFLRPSWWPGRGEPSVLPRHWQLREGRPWREGTPRVAVLSPYCPWPLSHGGAVRIYNLLREAARDFDIVLFAFEDGQSEADYQHVTEFCNRLYLAAKPRYREPRWSTWLPPEVHEFHTPELQSQMESALRECGIRLLQTEYTQMARYGGQVLVEHDVTWDLFQQIHQRRPGLRSWWDLLRWRRFENAALRRFPRVVAMSGKDAELLGASHVDVIPNGVDLQRFQPEPEQRGGRLLFIGSFRHFPNVAAYRHFVEEIWPLIRDAQPGLEVTVVAGPDPQLYWAAPSPDPRVRLLGFVSDVVPLYLETNLVLIPTVVSAGTNLKALEAMAMDRAIVSTPSGVAGLGLVHGESVWLADDAAGFAEGITRLLQDDALRERLARTARQLAQERFGWPALAELQKQTWRTVLTHE